MTWRMVDLFSGIGCFSYAAQHVWDDLDIVMFCEKDKFCQRVLKKHWPNVPILEDVRDVRNGFRNIDLVSGGYPCQAFSTASRGRRVAEDLSGEFVRVVSLVCPRWAIWENVERKTVQNTQSKLESIGYGTHVDCYSALDFGADHKRNRWIGVAHSDNENEFSLRFHAEMERVQSLEDNYWNWKNFSRVLRVFDGAPSGLHRTARLKALGNAIVWQVAAEIMRAIRSTEREVTCQA